MCVDPETRATPAWGSLPVEQYLIVSKPPFPLSMNEPYKPPRLTSFLQRNWDPSSPLSYPDQTRQLVRAFLALDNWPQEWDAVRDVRDSHAPMTRIPTDHEIGTILAPWRPIRWRNAATQLWANRQEHAVWLRTHYGEGSDAQFRAWRDHDEDFNGNFEEAERAWLVLDDPVVFNVGDEWRRALDVVPELVRPGDDAEPAASAARERLRERIRARVAAGEDVEDVAVWEAEYGEHGGKLQYYKVSSYLLVADARAWETQCLRMLLLDEKGNIVRHTEMEAEDMWESSAFWFEWRFERMWWWKWDMEGAPAPKLGDAYRARGEVGRVLYGLDL